jgi:phosphomannomutase
MADQILSKNKNAIIISDVRYIYNVKKIVEKHHGQFYLSPVGHALITKKLNELNADFCGESSGHYYFHEYGGAESVVRVILTIFDVLAKENKPLSVILNRYKYSFESGEINFKIPSDLKLKDIFEKIVNQFNGKIDYTDGLTIENDKFRLNIRGSNTEPLIRLNCESLKEVDLEENLSLIKNYLLNLGLQII